MTRIKITEETADADAMAEALRYIAHLVEDGFTSGYHPTWELDPEPSQP